MNSLEITRSASVSRPSTPGSSRADRAPKRTKDAQALIERELNRTIRVTENGTPRTITMREAFIKSLVTSAIKGERDARKMIFTLVMSQKDVEGFTGDTADQQALDDLFKRLNPSED